MRGLAILAIFIGSCRSWSPTAAESAQELFVVAETARFSGIAKQNVRGEISTWLYMLNCLDGTPGCRAFGWYVGDYGPGAKGVAYFYQPDVNAAEDSALSWAASHEVCHSITGPKHDARHAECNRTLHGGEKPASAARFRCLHEDREEDVRERL